MLYERGVSDVEVSRYDELEGPRDRMWSNAEDFLD